MASVLDSIPLRRIDGRHATLRDWRGKVRLVVNVASQCGLTPQYKALEALHRKYSERGFVVLGFPSNEFGGQEPGTDQQIQEFCSKEYDVTFPLFSKIVVKGDGKHRLYKELTNAQPDARSLPDTDFRGNLVKYGIDPGPKEEVLWNFEKFLVDRNGEVIARFSPDVEPDAAILLTAIEAAINAPS